MARLHLHDRVVDLDDGTISGSAGSGTLTVQERRLLGHLVAHADRDVAEEELLREVWGWKPHLKTRAVFYAVRRLRTKLEADPAAPVHLISVRGIGYRFVPAREPAKLPAASNRFVGRAAELAALREAWSGGDRLIVLLGAPGIGKTRLALEFAAELARSGTVDLRFCALADARDATGLVAAVAAAVDAPAAADAVTRTLARAVAPVLVLDNLEQLGAAVATISTWLAAVPGLRILATSRTRLELDGERCVEVGPLAPDDAHELFRERARARTARDLESDAVAEIVRHVEGVPLAIEIAAARAGQFDLATLVRRLATAAEHGTRARRDAHAHQLSLADAVEWSWRLLSPEERAALARCSVFHGGFDLAAGVAVVGTPDAAAAIAALCDHSLLRVDGDSRYGMYAFVQAWVARQLPDGDDAFRRHAEWYLGQAESGPRSRARAFVAAERDNLEAIALRGDRTVEDADARALIALGPELAARGSQQRRLELAARVLERGPPSRPLRHAAVLRVRAMAAVWLGDNALAEEDLRGAAVLCDRPGGEMLAAEVGMFLAMLAAARGDRTGSAARLAALHEAGARHHADGTITGDTWRACLGLFAWHALERGDTEETLRWIAEADLVPGLAEGHWPYHGRPRMLAVVHALRGEAERALELLRGAIAHPLVTGWDAADLRGLCGMIALADGVGDPLPDLLAAHETALDTARYVQARSLEAWVHAARGEIVEGRAEGMVAVLRACTRALGDGDTAGLDDARTICAGLLDLEARLVERLISRLAR